MKIRKRRKDFWWMLDHLEKQCHRRLKPLKGTRWKWVGNKSILVEAKPCTRVNPVGKPAAGA